MGGNFFLKQGPVGNEMVFRQVYPMRARTHTRRGKTSVRLTLKAAHEGMVLLKNDGDLLPKAMGLGPAHGESLWYRV